MLYKTKNQTDVIFKNLLSGQALLVCSASWWNKNWKPLWPTYSNNFLLINSHLPSDGFVDVLIDGNLQRMSVLHIHEYCELVKL